MASINGECLCCDDCANAIANGDTSGLDYYGDEYRAKWEAGVAANASELPAGNPCIGDTVDDTKREFMCDYCGRNVYSEKLELIILN